MKVVELAVLVGACLALVLTHISDLYHVLRPESHYKTISVACLFARHQIQQQGTKRTTTTTVCAPIQITDNAPSSPPFTIHCFPVFITCNGELFSLKLPLLILLSTPIHSITYPALVVLSTDFTSTFRCRLPYHDSSWPHCAIAVRWLAMLLLVVEALVLSHRQRRLGSSFPEYVSTSLFSLYQPRRPFSRR